MHQLFAARIERQFDSQSSGMMNHDHASALGFKPRGGAQLWPIAAAHGRQACAKSGQYFSRESRYVSRQQLSVEFS
jgi:hypothetical protein